jgi:hypothetical protein
MSGSYADIRGPVDFYPGLADYYATQAGLLLGQFEVINTLLGETSDWSYPGFLCETLLRDCLRKFLPSSLSVDKGYIYGRSTIHGKPSHCPEIDVLVHDSLNYRPLFRMGEFVIVQKEAVKAIIQVKRTLDRETAKRGVRNVVHVRQHLVNLWQLDHNDLPQTFSAVVGFREGEKLTKQFYHRLISNWHRKSKSFDVPGKPDSSLYVLPDFVGTLEGTFLARYWFGGITNRSYKIMRSTVGEKNVALQFLLWQLTYFMQGTIATPPFDFPSDNPSLDGFELSESASS